MLCIMGSLAIGAVGTVSLNPAATAGAASAAPSPLTGVIQPKGPAQLAPSLSFTTSLPPDPSSNYMQALNSCPSFDGVQADLSTSCETTLISDLDYARATYDGNSTPYQVPTGFWSMQPDQQLLILANQDRISYGEAPILGVNTQLDAAALAGAQAGQDPIGPSSVASAAIDAWGSDLAVGTANAVQAYLLWMYVDGYGSPNVDCTSPSASGCWGHRHVILWPFGGDQQLYMGAAQTVTSSGLAGGTTLLAQTMLVADASTAISTSFTWQQAEQMLPAPVSQTSTETTDTLNANQSMRNGQELIAGQFRLIMQDDGNLVEYITEPNHQSYALWASGTWGNSGDYVIMQDDGNLVIYGSSGMPLWSSGTWGNPGASLALFDNGDVLVSSPTKMLWGFGQGPASGSLPTPVAGSTSIQAGQGLFDGQNTQAGSYVFDMQNDGNLVVYTSSGRPLWSSGTWGNAGDWTVMQSDGNLVVYNAHGSPLWSTGTSGNPGSYAAMQSDSNLVVYGPSGPLWSWWTGRI